MYVINGLFGVVDFECDDFGIGVVAVVMVFG